MENMEFPCMPKEEADEPTLDCKGLKDASAPMTPKSQTFGKWTEVSGKDVLIRWDCQGVLQLGDKKFFGQLRTRSGVVVNVMEGVMRAAKKVFQCRAGMNGIVEDILQKYFMPWSMRFWGMVGLTDMSGDDFMDRLTLAHFMAETVDRGNFITGLPATCDGASISAGTCSLNVDLSDLVMNLTSPWNEATSVGVELKSCPNTGLIEGMVTCSGGLCKLGSEFIGKSTCTAADGSEDDDCGEGYQCADFGATFVANIFRLLTGKEAVYGEKESMICIPRVEFSDVDFGAWAEGLFSVDETTGTIELGTYVGTGSGSLPEIVQERPSGPSTTIGSTDPIPDEEVDTSAAGRSTLATVPLLLLAFFACLF
jgi:hypothetical protein